jgi:hypothetical protein
MKPLISKVLRYLLLSMNNRLVHFYINQITRINKNFDSLGLNTFYLTQFVIFDKIKKSFKISYLNQDCLKCFTSIREPRIHVSLIDFKHQIKVTLVLIGARWCVGPHH